MATTIIFPGTRDHTADEFHAPWPVAVQHPVTSLPQTWIRTNWSDTWAAANYLMPTEVTWSVAPTLPTATLVAHYGKVMQPYDATFADVSAATSLVGKFVSIDMPTQETGEGASWNDTRRWHGIITEAHDQQGGVSNSTGRAYGTVTLVAYGMEKLLADHTILDSYCINQGGFEVIAGVPIDFNRAGPRGVIGNRSASKLGDSYVFGGNPSTNTTWSSHNILEYLVLYQTPQDHTGSTAVQFSLDVPTGVPTDADAPILKAQNASTYSLISQLLDRRRVMMWWVEVDSDTNTCLIKADSMVATAITGNKMTIPANSNQINLQYDEDPLTNVVVNTSGLQRVDQVIAQGPRVRCVGSFHYDHDSIESAWSSANESTYEAGGTPHPGSTPKKRKQTRNDAARRSPTLESVYSLFQIPDDWDQQVGATGSEYPLFVDDDDNLQEQNLPELFIEQSMPLLEGEDYSGSRISAGLVATSLGTNEEMKPFVMFLKPWVTSAPYKYQNAEGSVAGVEITNPKENPRLSCHVSIPNQSRSIKVKVQGQPQHSIAFSDFTPISGEDQSVGEFDWKQAWFTFSILSQHRTQGVHPASSAITQGDAIKRKLIFAGDQYFRDYVAPGTVVGLDEDGELVFSIDGGHIPKKDSTDDPVKFLEDIAEISASWYTVEHLVLTLESNRLKPREDIPLGSLVIQAGGDPLAPGSVAQTINAPITQITFSMQQGGDKPRPAMMKLKTWAGELDAVEFVAVKSPMAKRRKAKR